MSKLKTKIEETGTVMAACFWFLTGYFIWWRGIYF